MTILPDESFVLSADTSYMNSGLGISSDSFFDKTLIKVNQNHKIEWISTFDLNKYFEGLSCLHYYNSFIYFSMVTDINYYCLLKINISDGHVVQSQ